jgi:aldose 1-epimerase
VVAGVDAGLRTDSVGGRAVIDGYDAGEVCPSGRGQLLVPWPNRIEDRKTFSRCPSQRKSTNLSDV